jgi:hypothetical protein
LLGSFIVNGYIFFGSDLIRGVVADSSEESLGAVKIIVSDNSQIGFLDGFRDFDRSWTPCSGFKRRLFPACASKDQERPSPTIFPLTVLPERCCELTEGPQVAFSSYAFHRFAQH